MALSRRSTSRFAASIWPGFVDAMTALILVLFFVLSIFMIVQFVLRDTITGQETEIDAQNLEIVEQNRALGELSVQVATLADALGLERSRADTQEALVATLNAERETAEARISTLLADRAAAEAAIEDLTGRNAEAAARISEFESQVASLIARSTDVATRLEAAEAESAERLDRAEALDLALASARSEVDAQAEAARLAAARREALEALTASLRSEIGELETATAAGAAALDEAEAARLAEAAAAEALRARLADADAELTSMTLNLEAERQRAEDTLTLLAAAEAARDTLEGSEEAAMTEADRRAAELAQARALLADQTEISAEAQRQVALLNQQTAALRQQLDGLQGLLDAARADDVASQVRIETLGSDLNAALARVASEQSARADLEARERARLEAEAQDLGRYRSEFFGRMRDILGEREGVQVVGDRFVFPSEVLFDPGSATLAPEGRAQVARVAEVINDIADDIPEGIDWILRVDGHTDSVPVTPGGAFDDNWELSQARALSVVQYMIDAEGIPANRLAATGFGEYQPVDTGTSPEALARNRRIELKFTER